MFQLSGSQTITFNVSNTEFLISAQRKVKWTFSLYKGADKSLTRTNSRCILFDGENISFDASLVVYINNTNIPLIMIINRLYETQNLLSL